VVHVNKRRYPNVDTTSVACIIFGVLGSENARDHGLSKCSFCDNGRCIFDLYFDVGPERLSVSGVARKILIVTLGSRGDVHPYIALGVELERRGFESVICTGKGFDDDIEKRGLRSATLDVDFLSLLTHEFIELSKSPKGILKALRLTKGFSSHFLSSLWDTVQSVQPAAIIYHHNKGAPALYAAIAQDIPAIPTALIPAYLPTRAFNNPFALCVTPIRSFRLLQSKVLTGLMNFGIKVSVYKWKRRSLELKRWSRLSPFDGFHPQGTALPRLHLFDQAILPKPRDWPEMDDVTGYCFLDHPKNWMPPQELEDFIKAGETPIYVGFGSMPADDTNDILESIIQALGMLGRRGIIQLNENEIGDTILPPSIFLVQDIPHDWLFPQCDVIVHHGGIGTTHQALRWGKPSVICPLFLDQPFWGEVVYALGASSRPLAMKQITAETLAKRIQTATSSAVVRAAKYTGDHIRSDSGSARTADIIASVLAE